VLGSADMPRSVYAAVAEIGARPFVPGRDYFFRCHADRWDYECGTTRLPGLPLPALTGTHQVGNAAAALTAIVAGDFGVTLPMQRVATALRTVRLPGRFQIVPGEVEWVLDVAHNLPAAVELDANLRALPRRRTFAVCGILGDKDIAGITAALADQVDEWILVSLSGPRAVSASELATRMPRGAVIAAQVADVTGACGIARARAQPGMRILVFGSFLTVGPALEFLGL
jgi:dihydrofolate synthase / folylpolyglutamate synthase